MARKSKNAHSDNPSHKRSQQNVLDPESLQSSESIAETEAGSDSNASPFPPLLPLLPIRNEVYFPHMIFPLLVGREKSVRALEDAAAQHRYIVIVTQSDAHAEDPDPSEIYTVGIISEIMQILRVPDGTVRVMLEGLCRCQIARYVQTEPFYIVEANAVETDETKDLATEALMRSVCSQFEQVVNAGKSIQPEALINVMNTEEPGRLADVITPYLRQMRFEGQQEVLETVDVRARLELLAVVLRKEAEIQDIQRNIRSRVEKEMGDTQREYLLREQLKVIQQELGERDENASEIQEYINRIAEAALPQAASDRAARELKRLEKMPSAAPEGVVIRTYLDTLISLPWSKSTEDRYDLTAAAELLDLDHFGLQKVKERILEFLAVRKLTGGSSRGPILCFSGPPGVGKTSIGKSIAAALGRKFIRVSLGGVRDEAEIRGHRRTYVGSMPGRILQGIRQCGSLNPVFMLDEIDKLGMDYRGDPSSALLEALDPEQNSEFSDHYLELPFDLSNVMFVTTANLVDTVPAALRDRMEVISFPGYTAEEKFNIARQFLIPKQRLEHGLATTDKPETVLLDINDRCLHKLIAEYTREAGVRGLEREVGTLCRKVARSVVTGNLEHVLITEDTLTRYLGKSRFSRSEKEQSDQLGTATGLVFTEFGGDIISIEVSLLKGAEGRIQLTGQLGDVMKESAQTALSFIRSRASVLGVDEDAFQKLDLHVHVPAGGVPKDGPSAGITIALALASAVSGRLIRHDVAMTGEITLRGRVLPVGGLKEKLLAAHRAGIKEVIIPADNDKDLEDIPDAVRQELNIRLIDHMDSLLDIALKPRLNAGNG